MLYTGPMACPLSSKCCDNKNVQHICIICTILYVLYVDTICGVPYLSVIYIFFCYGIFVIYLNSFFGFLIFVLILTSIHVLSLFSYV